MTTIAWDGKTLAVDSQLTQDGVKTYRKKLWKYSKGHFAVAGDWTDYPVIEGYLETDELNRKQLSKDFAVLYTQDRKVYHMDNSFIKMSELPPIAIGSGWLIALTAMRCGKTAKEAIELACDMDIHTGGTVNTIRVGR